MNAAICPFKAYANIIGKPGESIHRYRLFNVAIVDVIVTTIASFIIAKVFKLPFVQVLVIAFLLGIISHRLFCVPSTIDQLIFGKTE